MDKTEFLERIACSIGEVLPKGEELQWEFTSVMKNNGERKNGIVIREQGQVIAPIIYLDSYYERQEEGEEFLTILQLIAEEFRAGREEMFSVPDVFLDFDTCKERLFFRLVNIGMNHELWETTPYLPWNDLALTVRYLCYEEEGGISSILVTNKELERWGVSWEDVVKKARENTKVLFPMKIMSMGEVLQRIVPDMPNIPSLYVLTNERELNGATCITYEEELWEIAKKFGRDIYILPSSIHEVLLVVGGSDFELRRLQAIVKDANNTVVRPDEILSYQVYFLSYKTGEVTVL